MRQYVGCGTGTYLIEAGLGLHTECQPGKLSGLCKMLSPLVLHCELIVAGSYVFMDVDYSKNYDEVGAGPLASSTHWSDGFVNSTGSTLLLSTTVCLS
jgi:hypothetical protein